VRLLSDTGRMPFPFAGLVAGYQATATHAFRAPLSSLELYLLNAYGDIFDLSSLFPPQPGTPPQQLGPWMGGERMRGERRGEHTEKEGTVEGDSGAVWQNRDNDRCSVLMKGVDGNKVGKEKRKGGGREGGSKGGRGKTFLLVGRREEE